MWSVWIVQEIGSALTKVGNHKIVWAYLTHKVPITTAADDIHKYFFIFYQRKQDLIFHVNPLLGRGFTCNFKPYFLWKIKVNKLKCHLLQFLFGFLRVNMFKFTVTLFINLLYASGSMTKHRTTKHRKAKTQKRQNIERLNIEKKHRKKIEKRSKKFRNIENFISIHFMTTKLFRYRKHISGILR